MRILDRLLLRLRSLFRRDAVERELDDEMRYHLEELTRQNVAKGLSPVEARRAAQRQFGGVAQLQEECRDRRRTRWIEDGVADLRYAFRLFAKSPIFTSMALLSLAMGIGANTAIFSFIEAITLRELAVRQPSQLVHIVGRIPGREGAQGSYSYPNYQWLRKEGKMFSHVFTWNSRRVEAGNGEEWIDVDRVSEDYFTGLGVTPLLGRTLGDESRQPEVAVLSHSWWTSRFRSNPNVVGTTIRLHGLPHTIVGVTPEGFRGPNVGSSPAAFIPLSIPGGPEGQRLQSRNSSWLPLMARLRPDVNIAQASAGIGPLWKSMVENTGPTDRQGKISGWFATLQPQVNPAATGISSLRRRFERPLTVLAVVVGLVLLIACVNLSNLLLARSLGRQREFALRVAIGAGRGRLLRQMFTENLLLAGTGAILGLLFALWSSNLLASMLTTTRDTVTLDLRPNLTVIAFTAALAIFTTLLFGLVPALRAIQSSLQPMLKEGGQQVKGPRTSSRSLLVLQVALSLILVAGSALFLRTFQNLLAVELGFDADRVLIASLDTGRAGLKEPNAAAQFQRDLRTRLTSLAGVEAASIAMMTPIQGCCWWETLNVEGYTPAPNEKIDVFLNAIAPDYFRVMGTRLLRGRDFDARDTVGSPPVAIVSESFARKYYTNGDALGRIISLPPGYKAPAMEIIGVVEDARFIDLRGPTRLAAYFPMAKSPEPSQQYEVLIRTASSSPLTLTSVVRQQVQALRPDVSVRFRTLAQEVDSVVIQERLLAMLSAFFGTVALILAGIGLYGVLSYSVTSRTSEIGVRIALGASRASVIWIILRQSLILVTIGLILGSAAVAYLSRLVKSLLFGVVPADPLALAGAAAILAGVAFLAAWLPARRATAIDPVTALRYE